MAMKLESLPNNLIVFDGVCQFCNASINFIIRNDPNTVFYFTTTQSRIGIEILEHLGLDANDPTTFVLIKDARAYTRSSAALEISKNLRKPWSYLRALAIFPQVIRDAVYTFIAKNRYRILGKRTACMVPSSALKSRFLE